MVSNLNELGSTLLDRTKSGISLNGDFLDNILKYYKDKKGRIPGIDHATGAVNIDAHDVLSTAAQKVKGLKEDVAEAKDFMKEYKQNQLIEAERELAEKVVKHKREFHDVLQGNKLALEELQRESKEVWKQFSHDVSKDIKELQSVIKKSVKNPNDPIIHESKVSGTTLVFKNLKEAEDHLTSLTSKKLPQAEREFMAAVEKAEGLHKKTIRDLEYIAEDVKRASGHDLMAAAAKGSTAAETVGRELAHDTKGFGVGNSIGLGVAALLGVDGVRRFTGSESTGTDKAIGFAETAGGLGLGYKMLVSAGKIGAKAASHGM